MSEKEFKFPDGFLWGASTSAHQVEGENTNTWSEWEKENAGRLAEEAKSYWQPWQLKKFPEILNADNYISGSACDHYRLFEEDFRLAKKLGHTATRISIEWSRIEPREGEFSEEGIAHYQKAISVLRELGIEPFITLWHWPLPLWLGDRGGWEDEKIVEFFARYSKKMAEALGKDVHFWITINEPEIYSSSSYLDGNWPPQKKDKAAYRRVFNNLINAHKKAYFEIKKTNPGAKVGVAKNNIYFENADGRLRSRLRKMREDQNWNFLFLNRIKKCQDFIGLNHYFHNRIVNGIYRNENKIVSDLGWEIYPEGIYFVLKDLKKYGKPIYILENGLADKNDERRGWFIWETLRNIKRAMNEGVDVKGYLHWSLIDNFEWDKGFWPRFGLIEVDYKTMERKPRHSAEFYREIIEGNGITKELLKRHSRCCLKEIE